MVDNIEDLKQVIAQREPDFEVSKEAFDLCYELHIEQVSGTGVDWSITATNGWMAIFTNFNHSIHRRFMSQKKRDKEDLKHLISELYIIKKTDQKDKFELVLRK